MSEIDYNDDTRADDNHEDREDGASDKPGKQDYEVGYGKPPRAHQFPKGKSGNPRGPKKGSRGLKKDLHKALSLRHSIKVNGKTVTGTTQQNAMFTLALRAGNGDLRAIRELVALTLAIYGPEDRGRERATLSAQDQELFERMLGRTVSGNDGSAGGGGSAGTDTGRSRHDGDEHDVVGEATGEVHASDRETPHDS